MKKIKRYNNGKKEIVEEEYHKQINIFAKVVGKKPGLILGYEKITCNGNEGDAEGLFKMQKPIEWKNKRKKVNTNVHKERRVKCWSEVLKYKGEEVKVVKYEETYKKGKEDKKDVIYVLSTDVKLDEELINKIIHARWDIENNGFNELKNYWNMKHCYIAEEKAIDVILQTIIMSYNLWEMYIWSFA